MKLTLIKTSRIDRLIDNYDKKFDSIEWMNLSELAVFLKGAFDDGDQSFSPITVIATFKFWMPEKAEYRVTKEKYITIYIRIKQGGMFCNTVMHWVNAVKFDIFLDKGSAILRLCWG